MEMTVHRVPTYLRRSVAALWELRGHFIGQNVGLPKPYVELVVSLSGYHLWRVAEDATPISFTDGWLNPVQSAPRFAETHGPLHLIGARLHPAAAARLFGPAGIYGPANPVPLDALLAREGELLRQRLLDAPNSDCRFYLLASWLGERLLDSGTIWLPDVLELDRIRWRVDALADDLGLSPRGLHKRFVQQLGITPKLWLQLGRFNSALRCSPASGSLAELAVTAGYADQAHLTTEFRRFAGVPPRAYVRSRTRTAAPENAPHLLPATV